MKVINTFAGVPMKRYIKITIGSLFILCLMLGLGYLGLSVYYENGFLIQTYINGIYCTGKSVEAVNQELNENFTYDGLTVKMNNACFYIDAEENGMNGKKVLSIIVLIIGVLIVLGNIAPMIITAIMSMQISDSVGSSVGIIGGADGPTTIMVAGIVGASVLRVVGEILVGVLLIVAGILGIKKSKG